MLKSKMGSVPFIVWSVIFILVPLALVLWYSFTAKDGSGFTFENILRIGDYSSLFIKSIYLALIATAICLLLAYPFAWILSRMEEHTQGIMTMLVMLPMWMNFLLRTYGWMTLIEDEGVINKLLGLLNLGPIHMINTPGAVVLGMVYNYLPFMIMPLHSVMVKIDRSTIEAAQDLGAGFWQTLFRVQLPLSVPGIISGITMVFVPSVSTFIISKMLGGGSNMLIGDLIEQQFLGSTYNPYLGSAISLILMVIMLLLMGIMNAFDDDGMEGIVM